MNCRKMTQAVPKTKPKKFIHQYLNKNIAPFNSHVVHSQTNSSLQSTSSVKKQSIKQKKRKNEDTEQQQAGSSKKNKNDDSVKRKPKQPTKHHDQLSKVGTKDKQSCKIDQPDILEAVKGSLYPTPKDSHGIAAMLATLKECMLRQRWDEASQILKALCTYNNVETDYQWKCGNHVLQNHQNGNPGLVKDLSRFVRKFSMYSNNRKELEHFLYLLSQGRIEDASGSLLTHINNSRATQDHEIQTYQRWKTLNTAYRGLIHYYKWSEERRKAGSPRRQSKEGESKEAAILRRTACSDLSKVSDQQGVWDIFVRKHVEILESQGEVEEVENILTDYSEKNPTNPNAVVYLYEFVKRSQPKKSDKLKPLLKKLMTLLPAEPYTLKYVKLLEKTKSATHAEVLPALFNMADYSSCHRNTKLWTTLVDYVSSIVKSEDKTSKGILQDCWNSRRSWWPAYHFSKQRVSQLLAKGPKLAIQKAILASVFFGSSHPFVRKVLRDLKKKKKRKSAKELKRTIACWLQPAFKQATGSCV